MWFRLAPTTATTESNGKMARPEAILLVKFYGFMAQDTIEVPDKEALNARLRSLQECDNVENILIYTYSEALVRTNSWRSFKT